MTKHQFKDAWHAYLHACKISSESSEVEEFLLNGNGKFVADYACLIKKKRWPEAEHFILSKNEDISRRFVKNMYFNMVPELQPPRTKECPLMLGNYIIDDVPNTITDEQLNQLLLKLLEVSPFNLKIDNKCRNMSEYREYDEQYIKKMQHTQQVEHKLIKELIDNQFIAHFCILRNKPPRDDFA